MLRKKWQQMAKKKIQKKIKNIWRIIDGNKTLIGVALLYLDSILFQNDGEASSQTRRFAIYLWTGVGVGHKIKKQFSKVFSIRQSIDFIRNKRR